MGKCSCCGHDRKQKITCGRQDHPCLKGKCGPAQETPPTVARTTDRRQDDAECSPRELFASQESPPTPAPAVQRPLPPQPHVAALGSDHDAHSSPRHYPQYRDDPGKGDGCDGCGALTSRGKLEDTRAPMLQCTTLLGRSDTETQTLLDLGVQLPRHVPLAVASFAGLNLHPIYGPNVSDTVPIGCSAACRTSGAVLEPWGICDYLRDELFWPQDALFVDKEQYGSYNLDTVCPNAGCPTWIGKCRECSGPRNYRVCFEWALARTKVVVFFISSCWFHSPNCRVELHRAIHAMVCAGHDPLRHLLFVMLQPDLTETVHQRLTQELQSFGRDNPDVKIPRVTKGRFKTYDVSEYVRYFAAPPGRRYKSELKKASLELERLSGDWEELFAQRGSECGVGLPAAFYAEKRRMLAYPERRNSDNVSVDRQTGQPGPHPMRNRYQDDTRRININDMSLSSDELARQLLDVPMLGEKTVGYIVRERPFRNVRELGQRAPRGLIGDRRRALLTPYVTFGEFDVEASSSDSD